MKLNKLLFGVLMAGLFTACSNDDPARNNEGGSQESATGYLAVSVNLPQEVSTRADDSGVEFNDGDASEYAVDNVKLLLFKSDKDDAAEGDATFLSAYDMGNGFYTTGATDNNQITSSSIEAVEVSIDDEDIYLWALVLINAPEELTAMPEAESKFSDYLAKTSSTDFVNEKKHIFMTNAPLSNKGGGTIQNPTSQSGFAVTTLVKLGQAKDVIKPTLQEAKDDPAGCIYVERALAKVTATLDKNLTFSDDTDQMKFYGETANTDFNAKVTAKFGLRNINSTSYVVRNVAGFPENDFAWDYVSNNIYRMIGSTGMPALHKPLHTTAPFLYRTYWALDPNYNTEQSTWSETAIDNFVNTDGTASLYAKENTFDVAHMNYGNSTLAIFEVTFDVENNKDLYILNGDHHTIYKSLDDVTSKVYEYVFSLAGFEDALKAAVKEGVSNVVAKDVKGNIKISFERYSNTGRMNAKAINIVKNGENWGDVFDEQSDKKFQDALKNNATLSNIPDRINAIYEILCYKGGKSYYQVPIMHFGEVSTPWTGNGKNQITTLEAYGPVGVDRNKKYLGRYGLVRNNWYELSLNKFVAIGEPVEPEIDLTLSDDNHKVKQYIGIETHILSWAKRVQNVNF